MKNKISGIYIIKCIINNKLYTGSSLNIRARWRRHRSDLNRNISSSVKLQRAWDKYGENNFVFEIIEECTKENLISREQYWIDAYNSYIIGYNSCPIAGNTSGRKMSKQSRDKASKRMLGNQYALGLIHSDETKHKMSEQRKGNQYSVGRKVSEYTKEKLKIARMGKQPSLGMSHTNEAKEKIRLSSLGRLHTEESKEKIRQSKLGVKMSEEAVAKSVAVKKKNRELKFKSLYEEITNLIKVNFNL